MPMLILLRHGQSQWNLENRFTGCVDVPLSVRGEEEARQAGQLLKDLPIDKVYCSMLRRAIDTARTIVEMRSGNQLEIVCNQALNERHYGDLQGLNKTEMSKIYGEQQVLLWRRSFDVRPPNGESLKDTAARTLPYFNETVMADIKAGKNVLVVAHGNSLRSIVMFLEELSEEEVVGLNIPTGVPHVYDMDVNGRIVNSNYLDATIASATC